MAIEDNFYLKGCHDNDVISLSSNVYKVATLKTALNYFLEIQDNDSASYNLSIKLNEHGIATDRDETFLLLNEGAESEILKAIPNSNGWQKGKLNLYNHLIGIILMYSKLFWRLTVDKEYICAPRGTVHWVC
jgi:hypothetical protein